jgi:multidrug efflux pump subunit AcrB
VIGWIVRRPSVAWAAAVAVLLGGVMAFGRLPLATRTTVELPRLSVSASWPGAAPEAIEAAVTSPIEAAVQGVRGVRRVSSTSSDDQAYLTVELEPRADVQLARLAILERLELLRPELPPGVIPPAVSNYVPEGLEEAPLLALLLTGPYTSGALQQLLEERVRPRLSAGPGVAGVAVRGGASRGVAVTFEPSRLRAQGIAPQRLTEALAGARLVQALGVEPRGGTERRVVLRDVPGSLAALEALPVRAPAGRPFALGTLATVRGEEDARGRFFRVDGQPAVVVEVTRHPGADAIQTAAAVRALIPAVQGLLPPAAALRVVGDESEELQRELALLARRGAMAFGAVLAVLLVALRRWRAVALVMGTTAVAIAGTALSLYLLEVPANLLTLAGLGMGIGILVQNALVVVQGVAATRESGAAARATAARQLLPAVLGGTLTTGVVLLPFLYLQGNARMAFVPFAAAFVLALAWSVATALLLVPALGGRVAGQAPRWPRLQYAYGRVLVRVVRRRGWTLAVTAAVLGVLGWGFATRVPRQGFGGFGERRTTLSVSLSFPRGSDPATLDRAVREFEALVVGHPAVETVRAGAFGPAAAQLSVRFTRAGARTGAPLALQEALTQRAVFIGGASVSVMGDGPGFSSGMGGGSLSTFRLRVAGFSYEGVSRLADDLADRLGRIVRVRDVRITSGGGFFMGERGALVAVVPRRDRLAAYGLTAAALSQGVAREIRGPAGRLLLEVGGEEELVTVKAAGAPERTVEELATAPLASGTGAPVRIGDVATVEEREALTQVVREDQQYLRQVAYDFRGPPRLARRTHDAFVATLSAPPGYAITDVTAGVAAEEDQSERGLWLVFGVGVVLVVLAVALVFDSLWAAWQLFLVLPLALGGVAAAFWGLAVPFTREAAVGVILVIGVAINQAILLVDEALARRRAAPDGVDLPLTARQVVQAARRRSGMVTVVTGASLASLLPLTTGADGTTLFGAIALATAGGTVAGAVAALVVVPALLVGRQRPPAEGNPVHRAA